MLSWSNSPCWQFIKVNVSVIFFFSVRGYTNRIPRVNENYFKIRDNANILMCSRYNVTMFPISVSHVSTKHNIQLRLMVMSLVLQVLGHKPN